MIECWEFTADCCITVARRQGCRSCMYGGSENCCPTCCATLTQHAQHGGGCKNCAVLCCAGERGRGAGQHFDSRESGVKHMCRTVGGSTALQPHGRGCEPCIALNCMGGSMGLQPRGRGYEGLVALYCMWQFGLHLISYCTLKLF